MKTQSNRYRTQGLKHADLADVPFPSDDPSVAQSLLARCPSAAVTPLHDGKDLAAALGVGRISLKDERDRMGLGSFKALGAAYVIAHAAIVEGIDQSTVTYVTASAGNHGQSVAAGAAAFGAKSVVYIAETVPEVFAQRLSAQGAQVIREGAIYEDSMAAAAKAADDNGWVLLSDASWPGYTELPHRLMEGYTAFMAEAHDQMDAAPTHVFLQAGVGGLAAAGAAMVRKYWGDAPLIYVVEPDQAPAIAASLEAGKSVVTSGSDSHMGRLDCKEPSLIALKGLARDADHLLLLTEDEGQAGADLSAKHGFDASSSGAAGLAGLMHMDRSDMADAHVMIILSEGPA